MKLCKILGAAFGLHASNNNEPLRAAPEQSYELGMDAAKLSLFLTIDANSSVYDYRAGQIDQTLKEMIAGKSFDFSQFNAGHYYMLGQPYDTGRDILGLEEKMPGVFDTAPALELREPA